MTVCTLIYNASTGSDTAASGSNAPTAAVTGTNGDISTTTFTLNETVDFTAGTGVLDDDTDVLWINTPAGDRHLYRITAFVGGVATCTALTVTPSAGTARTADSWAVGGIRQSFSNDTTRVDFEDMLAGWDFRLQDTATFVLPTSITPITLPVVGDLTNGPARIMAASGDSPTFTWSDTSYCFVIDTASAFEFHNLSITNSSITGNSQLPIRILGADTNFRIIGCTLSAGGGIQVNNGSHGEIIDCDIEALYSTTAVGIDMNGGRPKVKIMGCSIHNCTDHGIELSTSTSFNDVVIVGNVIRDSGNDGMSLRCDISSSGVYIANNVLHSNGGDGIDFFNTLNLASGHHVIVNNLFTENGAFGIDINSADDSAGAMLFWEDYNFFRGNTSGEVSGVTQSANDVSVGADPYTNEAGDDYSLNAANPGGAQIRDAGFGRTS